MTTLIIFAVVITIGLVFYFSKSKKKDTKGGEGGKEDENYQDPTKTIYKP